VRLRPIIMSNVAIAVALLPQALGTGAGASFRIPMAVVTIGGSLVAAVFTLFLIPVLYAKVEEAVERMQARYASAEKQLLREGDQEEPFSAAHPR
jgi:Cu/Ag efflux pump CusA